MNIDTTETTQITETAIGYIPGYVQPFVGFNLNQNKSDLEYLSEWIDLKTEKSDETATLIIEKITEMLKQKKGYKALTQTEKNLGWFLPRPKPDHYKGGKPLYAEEWLIQLGKDILGVDKPEILNLFCGMNKYGFRIDIKPEVNPDLLCDAHSFADKVGEKRFNLIIANPPYSTEEARDIYGTPPIKYKKWTAECDKVLDEGGLLMVYHKYVMPNPNPEKYVVVKRVFIGNRTMHLPRVCIVFQKKAAI